MNKWIVTLLGVAVVTSLALSGVVRAAEFRTNDSVTVAADETLEDDLYTAANTVRIEGRVAGDVYAAGQQIIIDGTIEGDLFAAGNTISIGGEVLGGVRAVGQTIDLAGGEIGGGVTFMGSTLSSSSQSQIGYGLLFLGNTATLNGDITHGVTAFGSRITIDGAIGTDSDISTESLRITEGANIEGDITLRSEANADIADNARIAGDINREPGHDTPDIRLEAARYAYLAWSLIAALIAGAVLLLLARKPLSDSALTAQSRPLLSFGTGLLALIVAIPLGVLLMITVFGIPLAILFWIAIGVSVYISKFVVGIALGRLILGRLNENKRPRLFTSFALGLIVIYALRFIPFIGWAVALVVTSIGVGAILQQIYASSRPFTHSPTVDTKE